MTGAGYSGGSPRGENSVETGSEGGGVALRSRADRDAGATTLPRRTPPSPPHRPPEPPVKPSPGPGGGVAKQGWIIPLAVVVVGMFMSTLDTSIVNVAIPTMQQQFGVSTDSIQWVSTAYTLCLGVIVPTSAWLGERVGLKRLYVISLLMFSAFSALCGMAGDLNSMIFYRILQAIPGGVIPVTCLTILYKMVPREKIGAAMGLYGLGIVVAPGVGPTLGGYLVEYVDWRLIFYINVPVGVLGAILAIVVLPRFPGSAGRHFDMVGFLFVATGLFALLLALSEGQDWGWTGYRVLILLALAANCLVLFVLVELQSKQPLLNVRVFRHWPFVNSVILISILSVGLFAVLFFVPNFLQVGQNLTPMNAGLTLLPQALVMVVMMPLAGRIYDRIGPRWPAVIGLTITGIGLLLMTGINFDMPRSELIVWMMIRSFGLGLAMMPIMTGGISSLPVAVTSAGSQEAQFMADRSALLQPNGANVNPQIAQMTQQGPTGLIPLWQQLGTEVDAQAYSNVFLISGVLTLAAVALAFFLRNGRAASTSSEPVEIG